MILCLDIGGTSVKMGMCDRSGRLLRTAEADVAFDGYRTPILDTVLRESLAFARACEDLGKPVGVGISATGQIDDREGTVIGSNGRIPHWEGSRLKASAEAAFGVHAWALNDANSAVLGECFAGRARGKKDVLMVTLGTGVGGGMVLGGRLYGGARGIAGELGHVPLYAGGKKCTCGRRGCFECYASTTALIARVRRRTGRRLDGRGIFALAASGDRPVQEEIARWTGDIAHGLTGLVHLLNPEMLLIGGGVSGQEEWLMKPLREKVLAGVMPQFARGLEIERATLGNEAGMIGAARWYMDCEEDAARQGPR